MHIGKYVRSNWIKKLANKHSFFFAFFIGISLAVACSTVNPITQTVEPTSSPPDLASQLQNQLTNTAVPPSPTKVPQMTATPSTPTAEPTLTPTRKILDTPTIVYTNTPAPSATYTPMPQIKITYHAVNLRRGPRLDYPIIGFLYEGDVVEVISIYGGPNGWYNVRLNDGLTGWVGIPVVEPATTFDMAIIPTAATIPSTSTATPTNTPTPTATFTPRPRRPQPKPTKPNATSIPPTATWNPYP